jgi:gliding motility-associated-like protein
LNPGVIIAADCGSSNGEASVVVSGGTGSYDYSWSPSGGNGATASGISGGSYTVTVTDDNLCSESLIINVPTTGGPTISIDDVQNVSCFGGNDGSATISATGGTAPYGYAWSPSGGSNATASSLSAGNYTISVTDAGGCISVENITITEPTSIAVNETIVDENCGQSDGSVTLTISGGTGPYDLLWSPGGETTNSITNIASGSYSVTVTDANGCDVTENYTVNSVGSIPVIASPTYTTITAGEEVQLTASGANSYIWTPTTGLSCSDCSDPIATPLVTTAYIVTGTDAFGCTGTDTVTIFVEIDCADLFVPTIFSPNGVGPAANELLCVHGNCVSELTFRIFNRWGQVVFESETAVGGTQTPNSSVCWDGTFKGNEVQSGTYVYTIYARLFDDTIIEESGNLTVVR